MWFLWFCLWLRLVWFLWLSWFLRCQWFLDVLWCLWFSWFMWFSISFIIFMTYVIFVISMISVISIIYVIYVILMISVCCCDLLWFIDVYDLCDFHENCNYCSLYHFCVGLRFMCFFVISMNMLCLWFARFPWFLWFL